MIKRGETVFVAVLILFSAAALWQAWSIAGFDKWSSPGVFPMLASGTMLICALFIYKDTIRKIEIQPDTAPVLPTPVIAITVALILYVITMPTLGFLLASFLFLFASISYLWKKPVWIALLVSAFSLAIVHIIFRLVFQVILPYGTLLERFR